MWQRKFSDKPQKIGSEIVCNIGHTIHTKDLGT